MRFKLVALALLALPVLPLAAHAGDSDHVIPPTKMKQTDPFSQPPIDVSKLEISTLTPADRFVNATTPLVIGLGLGSIALVIYTLAQGAKESELE